MRPVYRLRPVYRCIGLVLALVTYVLVLWPLWKTLRTTKQYARRMEAIFAAGAVRLFAFFLFNTEMHERYLFPFVIFGVPLVFLRREYRVPYWGASLVYFANIASILRPFDFVGTLHDTFTTLDGLFAGLQVGFFFLLLWRVRAISLRSEPKAKSSSAI